MAESRDQLARRLYVEDHRHQNPAIDRAFEAIRGSVWDDGDARPVDVDSAYRRADEILAQGGGQR